jgi:hypothetical protein
MSNFNSNSAGNGNSPSERTENPLTLIPESIFPDTYQFEYTEAFYTGMSACLDIALPSDFKLRYWEENVGNPAWEKAVAQADEANQLALAKHEKEVSDIAAVNCHRTKVNRRADKAYASAMTTYERELAELPARQLEATQRATGKVKQKCVEDLHLALDKQSGAIEDAIDHALDIVQEEKRTSRLSFYIKVVLAIGVLSFPTVIGTSIAACVAYFMRLQLDKRYRRRFAEVLNTYNYPMSFIHTPKPHKRVVFLLRKEPVHASMETAVVSPVQLTDTPEYYSDGFRNAREDNPLGKYDPESFAAYESLGDYILILLSFCWFALPGVGLLGMLVVNSDSQEGDLKQFRIARITRDDIKRQRKATLTELLMDEMNRPTLLDPLVEKQLAEDSRTWPTAPRKPQPASHERMLELPSPPELLSPSKLTPPESCYDTEERCDFSHILKGSLVHSAPHVGLLSRHRVFQGDCVEPYFMFGGVPIPLAGSDGSHALVVGTTGSGKTTTVLRLLSSLLPLTRRQVADIKGRSLISGNRMPATGDEWSRSRTFQAVVFNAKGEYLNHLKAFGFDQQTDLFSFDPTDPLGYAWDIATDIDDRTSIEQLAEQLIPLNMAANRDQGLETWLSNARKAVFDVIVSLRNAARAAGRKPDWNLRDLVQAFATSEAFWNVLAWHDTPDDARARYFDLAGPQQSSIFVTLREAMGNYAVTANRWRDLQQRGRIISLKHWARNCGHSVLLLPNTRANVTAYGPLNGALLKSLTNIVLQHENTFYLDGDGQLQARRRLFVFDEFGHAGRLQDIDLLLGEGRSYGVTGILGLHQLSQAQQTYGDNMTDSILGMCTYRAFLKAGDVKTAEWMSKFVGSCLRAYNKTSYTYGTSQSKSFTNTEQFTQGNSRGTNLATTKGSTEGTSDTFGRSSSHSASQQSSVASAPGSRTTSTRGKSESQGTGTNESHTRSESTQESLTEGSSRQEHESTSTTHSRGTTDTSSNSQSQSKELRGEAAIEPHEFLSFTDPAISGFCDGVYIAPSLPVWRAQLGMEEMRPLYEFPERLHDWPVKRTAEEDELVSRSVAWSDEDIARLGLDRTPEDVLPPSASGTSNGIALLSSPDAPNRNDDDEMISPESDLEEDGEEDEPPQADFNF